MKISAKFKYLNLAIMTIAILCSTLFSIVQMDYEATNLATSAQERRLKVFWEFLHQKGEDFRIVDGKLMAGDYVINGNYELPDKIKDIFEGTATIFMGDVRVSTNVLKEDGSRAVGTRLTGPAFDAIFLMGKPYRGEASILGIPYFTAYDPIRDRKGKVIGALYVGVKKSEFFATYNRLAINEVLVAGFLIAIFTLFIFVLVRALRSAEGALLESEDRLKSTLHGSPVPQFVIDCNHKVIYWNKALEQCTGRRSEEMVGTGDHWKAFYPDNHPTLADFLVDRKSEELDAWYPGKWSRSRILDDAYEATDYFPCLGDDGKWLYFTATLVHNSSGDVIGAVETLQDISERKQAQDELQEQFHFLQEVIDDIPTPVLFRNVSGQYLGCNKAFEEFLGVKKANIVGKSVYDVHPKEMADYCLASDRELLDSPETTQVTDATMRDANGACKEILFYKAVYTTKDGSVGGIVGTFIDITERKLLEQEVLKSQRLESLGLLAGGLAHDFNNIMTGIIGNISMAKLQLDPSHKTVKRLELCEKAAMQATELTRQLLTFAKGGEPVKKLINPVSLIRETVSFALRGSNIRSGIDIQDDLWSLEADESQLSQVLNNLLLNAAQAMPAGGEVTVRAVNEPLLHENGHQLPPGDCIRISVEDRGCGIPQEYLVRIFDPYFTTKPTGTGLGLASVYSIVKRHGGTIDVSSTPGAGSIFSIHLPAIPGMIPEDARTKTPAELRGSGRVLVMDDEDLIREIAAYTLEFLGFEVESCADGLETVERFRAARENKTPFSAVILDLTIPGGMGGKEVAMRILEIDPEAVLVVSSGYSSDPVMANFREFGFSGAVPKPFAAEELGRELNRLIPMAA